LGVMGCEKSQGPAAFLHQRVMNKFLLQLRIQNKNKISVKSMKNNIEIKKTVVKITLLSTLF
jgi:hypothetical protein